MDYIDLEPDKVPRQLRGDYQGRKFRAMVTETVEIPADAGLWSGGSRDAFSAVRLEDGAKVDLLGQGSSPFNPARRDHIVTIPAGVAIVRELWFCGKHSGLCYFVRPEDVAPLIPSALEVDLSRAELIVLLATREFVARARREESAGEGVDGAAFDAAKATLLAKEL